MELKREEQLLTDETGKYKDPYLDSVFMAAISEVYLAIKEAGYEPYDQLTGYVRTGNDQYITRRHNARKIVKEMDPEMIKQYLKIYRLNFSNVIKATEGSIYRLYYSG